MLNNKQKQYLIECVEEELDELVNKFPSVETSQVGVFDYEDLQVQIIVTRDDDEYIEIADMNFDEDE